MLSMEEETRSEIFVKAEILMKNQQKSFIKL